VVVKGNVFTWTLVFALNANTTIDGGGAVRNDGTLNVDHSRFFQNQTDPAWSGGAIASYGPLNITNSGTLTASKFTFSSDNTCALPSANTIHGLNPNGLDPLLTGLGNYGGSHQCICSNLAARRLTASSVATRPRPISAVCRARKATATISARSNGSPRILTLPRACTCQSARVEASFGKTKWLSHPPALAR
jgi:hypothetical protein